MNIARSSPSLESHYGYTPLFSERSIRLVQILQETSTGVPQCRLTTVSLDNKLPFVALSYTWGNPLVQAKKKNGTAERCCQISCNGCLLNVTQNLYDFLKRAKRGRSESCLGPEDKIWIDAICINQSSLGERSAQVRLMGDIYRAAKAVIVWLGEGGQKETQCAVELLRCISATPTEKLNGLKQIQIHDPCISEVLGECGGSTEHWRSLKQMFSRAWFSRIWIIQEIAFAENIEVLYGSHSLLWEDCIKACEFLNYSVGNDLQTPSRIPYAGSNAEVLSMFQEYDSVNLLDVLVMTRSFEASDPRDKIFAVLGLAALGRAMVPATEIIRVDYELTPAEVYLETTWAMIKKTKDLNFLAEVEDPHLRKITEIPTWVPDFSSIHRPSIYHQSRAFNADGSLQRSLTSLSNPRLLGTTAYRIGEVVYADYLGVNEPFIEHFPRMLTLLFELSPTYITGENRLEVLWRTIIQNGREWVSPAAADTAQEFRDWILLNMVEVAMKRGRSVSARKRIDQAITQIENYSKTDPTGIMPTQDDIRKAIRVAQGSFDKLSSQNIETVSKYGHELTYYQHMCIFRTNNGLLGLGQPSLHTGHSLWVIPGVSVPMVLQTTDAEDRFKIVWPAYVHGIMNGEVLNWDELDRQSIVLE